MYLYSVYGYEGGYTLTHDKEYSENEFKKCVKKHRKETYSENHIIQIC